MSADNQEFSIPFEESRRGAKSSPEEKAALGRLGRYLGSRAIDRPTIGDRRRGRGRTDINLPTGGKPGTRTPTGSRRDIDGDGWADEGTTKPVWVGVDKPNKKPSSNTFLASGKTTKIRFKQKNKPNIDGIEVDGEDFVLNEYSETVGYDVLFESDKFKDLIEQGWRLPNVTELKRMHKRRSSIGGEPSGMYWSDNQTSSDKGLMVTAVSLYDGKVYDLSASDSAKVRLVKDLDKKITPPITGLSSGKPPRYPRTPTLGAFLGKADEDFSDIGSWKEFKDIYDDKEVVFFDYETTGLVFDEFGGELGKGAPVQFGAVKIKNGKEVGRINLFMNPGEPLGEWSRNNLKDRDGNPLTDEWLTSQMSVEEAHRQLIDFAGPDSLFGVQNATFDKGVLDAVLEQMGEEWRPSGYLDTREIAALTLPKWNPETDDGPFMLDREGNKKPSSSLAAITEYLGVELGDGHHNADVDAFAASEVMRKIIDGAIEKNWSTDALNKQKRDEEHQLMIDKFNEDIIKFEEDKKSFLAEQENNSKKLSSGAKKIVNGNKNVEKANISFNIRDDKPVNEDDQIFFDDEGNFDSEAYNNALDAKEEEITKYLSSLSEEIRKSAKLLSEKNYPDKKEPKRFTEAKIQIEKAIPDSASRSYGDLQPLIIARDKDSNIVGIARFNKDNKSVFIEHIASYGQEIDTPDLGSSIFGKIVDIASTENMPIILESTPGSEQYWRSMGLSDVDAAGEFLDGNKFLFISETDVKKLSQDTKKLSSGTTLSQAFDEPIKVTEEEAAAFGSTVDSMSGKVAARRIIDEIQKLNGEELSGLQINTIENIVPGLVGEIQGKTLLDIELNDAFSETGKDLLNSISVNISTDGIPFVSADPIPQLSQQIPDKRDWRSIEIPKSDDVSAILESALKDTLTFKNNVWVDGDGNIVARRIYKDDSSILEYESEEARQRFPLLEVVAPKGYIINSDSIGLGSLNQDVLPGTYGEAWKKHGVFLRELARRAGEAMGDSELFLPGTRREYGTSTFLKGYIGGLINPSRFNMGINGRAEQYHHDLFGHLGTGRGFDRHGEWANDIAMMSMVDHPDSPLTEKEKLAVKHLHYMLYSANRMFRVGRLDEEQKNIDSQDRRLDRARETFDITPINTSPTSLETRVYAGDFSKVIEQLVSASEVKGLSSGKKIYDADNKDTELALAGDVLGVLKAKNENAISSGRFYGPPKAANIRKILRESNIEASDVVQDNDYSVSFNLSVGNNTEEDVQKMFDSIRQITNWAEKRQLTVDSENTFPDNFDFSLISGKEFDKLVNENRTGVKVRVYDSLASGRERPLIPIRNPKERGPVDLGKRNVAGYGQKDSSGKEVRKTSTKWLLGMTPDEISKVVIPSSQEEHFEMWADDIAGDTWRTSAKWRKFLQKYYDELSKDASNLTIDYSPESIEKTRDLVRGMLESSPQMHWMFQNFGAPLIALFTRDAISAYENSPVLKERMEMIRKQRGMDKLPFVSGLSSRAYGLIGLTPRALIDRESMTTDEKGVYPISMDKNRVPQIRDAHIDRSLEATLIHEYGHWLHYRAMWDTETNGKSGKTRSYYGSGNLDDPRYMEALDVAEEYANPDTDEESIRIYSEFIDLTGRSAEEMFSAHPERALTSTSYGNVNKREAIAEAFVAIMHPNKEMPEITLSPKLRRDIYSLTGVDPENLPWESRQDGRPVISLSSGAVANPGREKRRNRVSRALRQLVGADQEQQQQENQTPKPPYEFTAPERPKGLISFSAEPSELMRDALPIPTEEDMTLELENDVKQIPLDPIIKEMSSLNTQGFGTSIFASEEERKASASAKRMISLNISETAQINPKEFIESFSDEQIGLSGVDKESLRKFFNSAKNFRALKEVFDAIEKLPENATAEEKKNAGRFAVDRVTGSIVPIEKHDSQIKKRFYFDSIIDELEKKSYEELFGPEWENLTRIALNDDKSVVSPFLIKYLGGDEVKREMTVFGDQIRNMFNEFISQIKGDNNKGRVDPLTGKPLQEGEKLEMVFSPIGHMDMSTGKPAMALISRGSGLSTNKLTNDFRSITSDGTIIPEIEMTAEQRISYERLLSLYGSRDYLEKVISAGIISIDESNVDSQETKDLLKNFLIERLRFTAGFANEFKAKYEQKSGVSFFDIDTPEGLREARAAIVSDIIHTWAISANDSNPVALAIQHEARKMFSLDDAVGWYGRVRGPRKDVDLDSAIPVEKRSELGELAFDDAPELTERQKSVIRSVVKSIYDATQHYYKSKGITHLAVWRGMKGTPQMSVPRGELAERTVSMRPLSSWTTNSTMAQSFATTLTSVKKLGIDSSEMEQSVYDSNILMKAYVPVEQIFSNPLTGFGCLGEDEVVILGRPTNTIMVTPPANFLLDDPGPNATPEQIAIVDDINAVATDRDKITSNALRGLISTNFDDFSKRFNNKSLNTKMNTGLSSGKAMKHDIIQKRMKAPDMSLTFARDTGRISAAKSTLANGLMGGITVESDRMDDIKQGIAIARNKHGIKIDALSDFDAEGNPSDNLVDTFLAWMDFYGPSTFLNPKDDAEKTTIGGQVYDGSIYLDVVDVYENNDVNIARAAELGRREDQIAVTNLDELWGLLENGEDISSAFINSGGTGGFTLDENSINKISEAISELNSNKARTGSAQLKIIGTNKKYTSGPINGARRVRNTNFSTGEKQDYWLISGSNGLVKVFTHEQYIKARDKKIQGLFDKISTQSDVLASMFEAKNITPVASMSFLSGQNIGEPRISKIHKNRGLSSGMANIYGFSNNVENVGIRTRKAKSNTTKLSSGKKIVNKQTKDHDKAFKEKFKQDVPEGDGDCFSEAFTQVKMLRNEMDKNPSRAYTNIKVVHGYPLGTGGEAKGLRFPHAWAEFTDENGIEFVRDYSNGNRVEIPKAMYYLIGNIDENDAKKYSYEEAIGSMNESQHYGPW